MRIALCGSHKTGKSTLLDELAELLPGHAAVREPAEKPGRVSLGDRERVRARGIGPCGIQARSQELAQTPRDPTDDPRHLVLGRRWQRKKPTVSWTSVLSGRQRRYLARAD